MIVVDANVWVAVGLLADPFHSISQQWLTTAVIAGEEFAVPTIVLAEVAAAISRPSGDRRLADVTVDKVRSTPRITLHTVDDALGAEAARIASELGLGGADAVYVAVAARLACPLVTWDADIIKRAAGRVNARNPTA